MKAFQVHELEISLMSQAGNSLLHNCDIVSKTVAQTRASPLQIPATYRMRPSTEMPAAYDTHERSATDRLTEIRMYLADV